MNFYKHLQQGLESIKFEKSQHDDFLFMKGNMIDLFWVDDYTIYAKSKETIDELVLSIHDEFLLKREE